MRPKTGFGVGLIEHCGLRLGLLQAVLLLRQPDVIPPLHFPVQR